MIRYSLGFVFDAAGKHVILIKKLRPNWQAGKYNGLGGKLEANETPVQGMVREFYEEAGVMTHYREWLLLGKLRGDDFTVSVFTMFNDFVFSRVTTVTDEVVLSFEVNLEEIHQVSLPNVSGLICSALEQKLGNLKSIELSY